MDGREGQGNSGDDRAAIDRPFRKPEQRPLGKSELLVSSIGLGCVTFGREIDEATSAQIMDHAIERGINLFDTAAVYSDRESERIIGRWMKSRPGSRDRIVLATKINGTMRRQPLLESIDQSLRGLQTDRIDLFQLHHWPAAEDPLDEALGAMDEAVRQGKVCVLGVSNADASQLRMALERQHANGWVRFESLQPPYSLVERHIEQDVLPLCQEQQIGVLTYSPLGAGFLTGKYRLGGPIPKGTRFDIKPAAKQGYFTPEKFALVERLREASKQTGIPMAELALAWVFHRPRITSVLIGARTVDHIDQALRAKAIRVPVNVLAVIEKQSQ